MTLKRTSFGDNTNNNLIPGFSFLSVVVQFSIQFLNLLLGVSNGKKNYRFGFPFSSEQMLPVLLLFFFLTSDPAQCKILTKTSTLSALITFCF